MTSKTVATALMIAGSTALTLVDDSFESQVGQWKGVHHGVAVVSPTEGSDVRGVVRFRDESGGVRVTAEIDGLEPNSRCALHIHRYADAASAGAHVDPGDTDPHARPGCGGEHHAADMGTLEADASGRASFDRVVHGITIAGLEKPIIGRAVIVHAEPGELDRPGGRAGSRIAFGCIGVAKPAGADEQGAAGGTGATPVRSVEAEGVASSRFAPAFSRQGG